MNIHSRKVDGCWCKIHPSLKEEKDLEGSYNGFSFKIIQKSQQIIFCFERELPHFWLLVIVLKVP